MPPLGIKQFTRLPDVKRLRRLTLSTGGGVFAIRGLVAKGDSLTAGYGSDASQDYPSDLSRATGVPLVANLGVVGQAVSGALPNYTTEVAPLFSKVSANVLLFMMGTNDVRTGRTAAQIIADTQSYCALARLTGFKIALGTLLPSVSSTFAPQSVRDAVNVWLRANWQTIADWFMDFAAVSQLSDSTNTTYFNSDQVHLTDAGYRAMAECARAALAIPLLSASINGIPRFAPNPPGWEVTNPPTLSSDLTRATFSAENSVQLMTPVTGKKAFAFRFTSGVVSYVTAGVQITGVGTSAIGFGPAGSGAGYFNNGQIYVAGSNQNSGLSGIANGDVVGVCVDADAKKIWWTKDGVNFIGVGSLASLSDVVSGLNSTAQSWTASVLGAAGLFTNGAAGAVIDSVAYPWIPPSGFTQLAAPLPPTTIAAPIITWSSDAYHQLAVQTAMLLDGGSSAGDVLTREIASDGGFATIIATQAHTLTLGDLSAGAQAGGGSFSWPALGSPLPAGPPLYMRVRQSHGAQALVSNVETKTLMAPPELIQNFPNVNPPFDGNASVSGSNLNLNIPKYQHAYMTFSGLNVGDKMILMFTTSATTGAPFSVADFLDNPPSYGGNKIATGITGAVTQSIEMTVTDSAGRIAPYFDAPDNMTATFTALSFKKKVQ